MSEVERRLAAQGITVEAAPLPVAAYLPGVISGNQVFVSGQLPFAAGELTACGRLGDTVTPEQGYAAARQCALNCLSVLKALLGDLDRVTRVVRLCGFVNSTPDFTGQPRVINGASELMQLAFGEKGTHARSAVGAAALPLGAPCEVELVVEFQ